jgi:hypothetical protein
MNLKKLMSAFIIMLTIVNSNAQVNMQNGSLSHTIPVINYSDNLSKLSLNIGITYNSGNGLIVDEIPSSLGEGWNISGIPVVTRIMIGLPDDQAEKNGSWGDTTKYPPGYLYNTNPISDGCPVSLNTYPLFPGKDFNYSNSNAEQADRELDRFIFNVAGYSGTFVIDKNKTVRVLNGSRVKIDVIFGDITDNCRTLISKFSITDESGILYEFTARGRTRITRNRNKENWPVTATGNNYKVAYEVAENENPYIATDWYISSIRDIKSSRQITFEYNYNIIKRMGKVFAQLAFPSTYDNSTGGSFNVMGNDKKPQVSTIQEFESEIKPEISKIKLADNSEVNFLYGGVRKDCNGAYKLNSIKITGADNNQLSKLTLSQSYFVKNRVEEPAAADEKWARLCLTGIRQYGSTDDESTPPISFDYYSGNNDQEDFVPPIYFHAQDPWGYYNGDASGVAVNDFLNMEILKPMQNPAMQKTGF